MCRDAGTLRRLRESGVRYILSVQPFDNAELRLVDVAAPARTAPLAVYVYELEQSLPDPTLWTTPDDLDAAGRGRALEGARARYLDAGAGHVRVAVDAPRAAYLIVRRTHAPGWSATVNGRPAPIVPANGRHQAVAVPAGASEVALRYRSPVGWLGTAVSLTAAARGRRARAPRPTRRRLTPSRRPWRERATSSAGARTARRAGSGRRGRAPGLRSGRRRRRAA